MLEPFLKWPGGKRWLVHQYGFLFPFRYQRYLEPFLGGGAVFFHLTPRRAILSDTNGDLVNAYQALKEHARTIDRHLSDLQRRHSKKLYYRIRATRPTSMIGQAVRFLYLNRTCFNGIYRVNLRGDFNVPIGTKDLVQYPKNYLQQIADCLRHASIRVVDFEETIDEAVLGDFVFVDPPYTVMHNNNNFVKYNANLFSWTDQLRLASAVKRAVKRGAAIMISNADHCSIQELYGDVGNLYRVDRLSVLAADSLHRRKTTELVITSYDLQLGDHSRGRVHWSSVDWRDHVTDI
ncbi:MAG: DNA methyltransferase [Acidobacteria bacterium]|nr:MAG: DNA methyltransferase [Acidobacteriota bacterium]